MTVVSAEQVAVYATGGCEGLPELLTALEARDEVRLLFSEGAIADAGIVLFGVPGPSLPSDELARIREHTAAPVVLLAPAASASVLGDAFAAGVDDALLLPQPIESLLFAIRKATARRPQPAAPRARIVSVFSPKGGTGKTVTAANLGTALAKLDGRRPLLVDLDLQFGDAAIMLGLEPQLTIHDLLSAPGEIDADKLVGYTCRHASGLDLLAAPASPEESEVVSLPRLARVLEVARECYDIVVVDTAPSLQGPVLAALDQSDELLLVTTLDLPTLKDVRQALRTLELISFPLERVSMVLNRDGARVGITRREVEDALGVRMRYALPLDPAVPLAVNRGTPVVVAAPRAPFSRAIGELAASLLVPSGS